ncbi:MAG TPA: hypothetical protein VIT91_07495, partial [Chthoniobacterales bacterium]
VPRIPFLVWVHRWRLGYLIFPYEASCFITSPFYSPLSVCKAIYRSRIKETPNFQKSIDLLCRSAISLPAVPVPGKKSRAPKQV